MPVEADACILIGEVETPYGRHLRRIAGCNVHSVYSRGKMALVKKPASKVDKGAFGVHS